MEERSGADGKFITQSVKLIVLELQAKSNSSKSSLFIVTDLISTHRDTFETAIEIDGSRFLINSSSELQDKDKYCKDVGSEFSINKPIIFSTFQFISSILSLFRSRSLCLESN